MTWTHTDTVCPICHEWVKEDGPEHERGCPHYHEDKQEES